MPFSQLLFTHDPSFSGDAQISITYGHPVSTDPMHLEDRHGASAPPPSSPSSHFSPNKLTKEGQKGYRSLTLPPSLPSSVPPFTAEVIRHERAIAEREGSDPTCAGVSNCAQCNIGGSDFLKVGGKWYEEAALSNPKLMRPFESSVFALLIQEFADYLLSC